MSTDYAAICLVCREEIHIGVRFTSGFAFGHGSNDEAGRKALGRWIVERSAVLNGTDHDVRIVVSDAVPDGFRYIDIAAEGD